jgi:hypothetical protein
LYWLSAYYTETLKFQKKFKIRIAGETKVSMFELLGRIETLQMFTRQSTAVVKDWSKE